MRWIAPFLLCGRSLLPDRSIHGCARDLAHNTFPSLQNRLLISSSAAFSPSPLSSCLHAMTGTGYLNAADAAALDEELMSTPGFSLEQLMELAGLAVAEAVYQTVVQQQHEEEQSPRTRTRTILLVCGPGNNGGDGLVAARHLFFFGNCDCTVVYPKRSSKQHFVNLVKQCEDVGISILDEMPAAQNDIDSYDAIVDAIFGFSFKGKPREPFGTILHQLKEAQESSQESLDDKQRPIVLSVDVPSGWNVDEGDVAETGFVPDVLISLTAPKLCTKQFKGRHFIGGRFLPPTISKKYNIRMPPYEGVSQVMEVTVEHIEGSTVGAVSSDESWREEYAAYLAEKEQDAQTIADTTTSSAADDSDSDATPKEIDEEKNTSSELTWQEQYATHCIEKEARLAELDAKQRDALREE